MSRNRRVETLSPTEAASFVADAEECRRRLIPCLIRLRPQSDRYLAETAVLRTLDRAETAITGQAPHREKSHDASGHIDPSKQRRVLAEKWL